MLLSFMDVFWPFCITLVPRKTDGDLRPLPHLTSDTNLPFVSLND
jgi:hypothetical protein